MSGTWTPGPGPTGGNDTFTGTSGDDSAYGGAGNDSLFGAAGNDTLFGLGGDDTIQGGPGADSLVGGDGLDFVDYSGSAAAVRVVLNSNTGNTGGDALGDTLSGFEGLIGSSFNDTLTGSAGNDSIFGGAGNDSILGGAGNDTILGGAGADTLDGGDGVDIVSYDDATGPVFISIQGASNVSVGGAATGDVIRNFEGFIGSRFNDTLISPNGGFALFGNDGNDWILAGQQNDTIVGGEGEDTIFAGNSSDSVAGGLFNPITGEAGDDLERDFVIGGQGDDTVWGGQGDVLLGDQGNRDLALLPRGYTDSGIDSIVTYPLPNGGTATASFDVWTSTVPGSQPIYLNGFELYDFYDSVIPCFATGTMITTARGEVAVENLRVGDLVLTADGGAPLKPVIWIGHSRSIVARHPRPERIAPVLIKAGALGEGVPHRDLRVSPDHGMYLDGVLVPAKHLVNGITIIQEMWCPEVTYWHVELPAHGLVVSEGAVSESYLDDGNRKNFDNYGITTLFKDFASERANGRYAAQACRPVLEEGERLDRIRAKVAARAAAAAAQAAARRSA